MLSFGSPLASDKDEVKRFRDKLVSKEFGVSSYRDLSNKQRSMMISLVNTWSEENNQKKTDAKFDRAKMESKFWNCALDVAIHYIDFGVSGFKIGDSYYSGEPLRQHLREKFNKSRHNLKGPIWTFIVSNYVYPKSNDFLIQGKFKNYCKTPSKLYVKNLPVFQLKYLIERWQEIQHNLAHVTYSQVSQLELMAN
jgi:hypothetical protein